MFALIFFIPSCASNPSIQPQINRLIDAQNYPSAIELLQDNVDKYGAKNRLLYLLDYGLVLHYAGRYEESVDIFEKAKKLYDELYTISVSNYATTWLMNDNTSPYRGEDFERVMINVFQALNFALLCDFEEALVEARNVDQKLKLINSQYKEGQKNVYNNDAFARFLMGILYESYATRESLNDAYISYGKALDIYQSDYTKEYHVFAPIILRANYSAVAKFLGFPNRFAGIDPKLNGIADLSEKMNKAQVYLIQYHGLSLIKREGALPVPLPDGYLAKLAFPYYETRSVPEREFLFKAVDKQGHVFRNKTYLAEDIDSIAEENMENRRVRVIAKAVIRAGSKYVLSRTIEKKLKEKEGDVPAAIFKYFSSLYNIASEQADVRSWQTLPAQIRISRLILEPGEYDLLFDGKFQEHVHLCRGERKFVIVRTVR